MFPILLRAVAGAYVPATACITYEGLLMLEGEQLVTLTPTLLHTVFTITISGQERETEYDATTDEDAARNHPWLRELDYTADRTSCVKVRRVDVFSNGTATDELLVDVYGAFSHEPGLGDAYLLGRIQMARFQ